MVRLAQGRRKNPERVLSNSRDEYHRAKPVGPHALMLLLLGASLVVGCGDSSTESRDANAPDTVTIPDTGAKPDLAGDTVIATPDGKTAQPDGGTAPDTTPAQTEVGTDTPAPTGDGGPVITKDAPVDSAADRTGDTGSATEAGSADTGTTD